MSYSRLDWTEISLTRNAIQRAYEPLQIYFFTQLADWMECRSFCDVGANIGSFSVAMAQLQKLERIHSFEPMPTLHKELAKNVGKNDPSGKIMLHEVAISENTGSVDFAVFGNYSGANGVATSLIHDHVGIDRKITVPASTLDDVLQNVGALPDGPCFIKIDVEGHELSVLKGASALLEAPCVLQIEVYNPHHAGSEAINTFLSASGYRRFWQIGADQYYAKTDMCPSDAQLLEVVSRAHTAMIEDFQAIGISGHGQDDSHGDGAITRRFGVVQIRVFNPVSHWLRWILRRG